jgi:ABC-2 type transport system permease protein
MWRHLKIIGFLLRTSIAVQAQYRVDFLIQFALSFFWVFWNVAPLLLIYELKPTIAGWSRAEALLVIAAFLILKSLLEGLVMPNLNALVQHIRTGTFDFILLKPADAQVLVSASKVIPTNLVGFSAGIGLAIWASVQLDPGPSPAALFLGVVMLMAGATIIYALWIAIICTAFWFVKIDNLSFLFSSIFDAARYPIGIFRGWIRAFLTFVIPLAVMTSYPAMAVLGKLEPGPTVAALSTAVLLLLFSRLLWRWAVGHYASASS